MGVALTVCNLGLLQYCIAARLHAFLAPLPRSMETHRYGWRNLLHQSPQGRLLLSAERAAVDGEDSEHELMA